MTDPVTATLYKLLIYDKGSFFVGIYATLVLTLPSQSEGGELVVGHKGRQVRLELKCDEPSTDSKIRGQDGEIDAALNNTGPEKIVWPLEHAYTPAELAFEKLKGADAAVAKLLATAAPLANCDLHLALLSIWESGSAE